MHERALNQRHKESRINTLNLKRVLASFALVVCPGDDIALIAAQVNGTTHTEMPDVAIIHQVPNVRKIFEIRNIDS
jgi:hypothetical protein